MLPYKRKYSDDDPLGESTGMGRLAPSPSWRLRLRRFLRQNRRLATYGVVSFVAFLLIGAFMVLNGLLTDDGVVIRGENENLLSRMSHPYVHSEVDSLLPHRVEDVNGQSVSELFASLARDGSDHTAWDIDSSRRILFVTMQVAGPDKSGGIGTAVFNQAVLFATLGFQVSILYVDSYYGVHRGAYDWARWERFFSGHKIQFYHLERDHDTPVPGLGRSGSDSYEVMRWLRDAESGGRVYDMVIFPDYLGLGYFSTVCRRGGLALTNTAMVVVTHGPILWAKEMSHHPVVLPDLPVDFLERGSIEHADSVVGPSAWLHTWMGARGYRFPTRTRTMQNTLLPDPRFLDVYLRGDPGDEAEDEEAEQGGGNPSSMLPERKEIKRIVFFGRIEERKGVVQLCDAMDALVLEPHRMMPLSVLRNPPTLIFLGKGNIIGTEPSVEYVARRARAWNSIGMRTEIITDLDAAGAMSVLEAPGTLAVMPSVNDNLPYTVLEALYHTVPILASETGGVPELIHPQDVDECTTPTSARGLAEKLAERLRRGVRPCRLAKAPLTVLKQWADFVEETVEETKAAEELMTNKLQKLAETDADMLQPVAARSVAKQERAPLVSVIMTSFNRPQVISQAVDSLLKQTFRDFEVILVDDASTHPDMTDILDRLEAEVFRPRGWRIIRKTTNTYLGNSRRWGIDVASGEYLFIVDDDDYAKPMELEALVRALRRSSADIATQFVDFFDSTTPPANPEVFHEPPDWAFFGAAPQLSLFGNVNGPSRMLMKRHVYDDLGGFHEIHGVGSEDHRFLSEAVLAGKDLITLPQAFFFKRGSRGSGGPTMTHVTSSMDSLVQATVPYSRSAPHPYMSALFAYMQHQVVFQDPPWRSQL